MTKVGAAITTKSGQTWAQAISAFETLTERYLPVRRCYDGAPVADINSSAAKHDLGLRKSVLSIKPTISTSLSTMESLAASIVAANHECDVIIYHEPVDNMSGADFIALYQRSCVPFRDKGIPVGVCYTNWSATQLAYTDTQSALVNYWPGDTLVDFIAIDEYPINEISSTKDTLPMEERVRRVAQFADVLGKPLSLTEFGVQGTWDVIKSERWFRSVTDWALQRAQAGVPLRDVCYFHSDVGGAYWLDSHGEYVDAYKDMAALLA